MKQDTTDALAMALCAIAILVIGLFLLYGVVLNVVA